ncbi:hypothetical protein [Prosthecobacter sp.]|uniref:hypothetical protein n=1 Tax=Prosthecobacter sp. TaxID=1965333 RepID=UPI0037852F9E
MMKINPAALLFVLLALGGAAAFLLPQTKPAKPTASATPEKTAAASPTKSEEVPNAAADKIVEDLKKQIVLLEGQIEYLQGQNDALKDENAQMIQKLGMLGAKNAPKMDAKAEDVAPDFVGMGLEMMKMRNLRALPLVTTEVSQMEVELVILAWLKRQQPNDEAKKFARGLAALGWIPEAIDPLPLRAAMLSRQLGGWYDEESETMFTIDPATASGPSITSNEPLGIAFGQLLREYGDILYQPQHGALKTDMRLARDSLITGDAALTRFLHSLQKPASAPKDDLPPEDPDHPLNQVPMPAFLRELYLFPFSRGFDFAQTLHSADSFAQLNAAYSRPPVSTAEVIEPEMYLDPEHPATVEVQLDDVKLKGVLPYLDDRLGKFACVTALRTYNDDEPAALGARGLVADRLLAWTADGGAKRDHAAWQTLFMDKASADAFYTAMLNCLKQRYETKGENEFTVQGRFVSLLKNRDESGVLLIEAASEEARAALKLLIK